MGCVGFMSLRSFSNINELLVVSALVFGLGAGGTACAAPAAASGAPAVQTYADQAVPAAIPPTQEYYDSPRAAGTLTLEDVLEAHKPPQAQNSTLPSIGGTPSATATAPLLTPPVQSSSTSLMMSQGMKAVLQKVGGSSVPAVQVRAPSQATQAQGQPVALTPAAETTVNGVTYQPGQQPKNLAAGAAAAPLSTSPASSTAAAITSVAGSSPEIAATTSDQSCDQKPQKWEKSCSDAGYPASYFGKIVGETRTGCADGVLHDVWVSNTCAPPDAATAQTEKVDGSCGTASNNDFDAAPSSNLCAQGIASAVSGEGPWTWACSGVNGGDAAACTAPKHVSASNGVCGSANGVSTSSAPSEDLCRAGAASPLKGNGPWTWSCKGNGKGRVESCIAPVIGGSAVVSPAAAPVAETSSAPAPSAPLAAATTVAPSNEKGELCGAAAETLAYEAPDKDLCRAGNASVVNGEGPWTWSCTNNEGVTSSCRTLSLAGDGSAVAPLATEAPAPKAAPEASVVATSTTTPHLQAAPFATAVPPPSTELACGLAAAQSASQIPTSNLCENGKASTVRGSGPWKWTCSNKAHRKVSCETLQTLDGACGPANGAALKSAPFAGLCTFGTPSSIEGNGPWTWTCNGNGGGVNVSCAATLQDKAASVDGTCGAADNANMNQTPSEGLCASGTPSAVSGEGPWSWSCSGSNGGKAGSCSANKIIPPKPPGPLVNGLCGLANGVTVNSQPSERLCASGAVSGVVGNGPWNWSCAGENGGMTVSCTAPLEPPAPIDGVCGGASGVPTLVRPEGGLCAGGITGAVNGKGPWTWTCSGANGGNPASCIAPVAGKSSSMPSIMTTASDGDMMVAPETAPSGLVTPHLPSTGNIPSLDKKVIPSLTTSKAFAPAPTPSQVPPAMSVAGDEAPANVPDLPQGSQPLQPPALRDSLTSAPVLKETAASRAAAIPGNHLTLDPTISTILFERGSGNISENVLTTLDKLATVLQNNPDVRISLIAYADNGGSTPRDARRLSLERALAVRTYLSSKDISESRMDVHAEGTNTTSGYLDRVDIKVND